MIEVRPSNCLTGGPRQSWERDFQKYFAITARQGSHSKRPSMAVADLTARNGHGFVSYCNASSRLKKCRTKNPTVHLNSEKYRLPNHSRPSRMCGPSRPAHMVYILRLTARLGTVLLPPSRNPCLLIDLWSYYVYLRTYRTASTMFHVEHIANLQAAPSHARKRARRSAPHENRETYRPKPADCMDCRDRSEVEAMPCMRSLNSSAFDAFSRAVS